MYSRWAAHFAIYQLATVRYLPFPPLAHATMSLPAAALTATALLPLLLLLLAPPTRAGQLWAEVCTQADVSASKWCDKSLPAAARAAAFVAVLEADEKIGLMTNEAKGVPRLHIPMYQWGAYRRLRSSSLGCCSVGCNSCGPPPTPMASMCIRSAAAFLLLFYYIPGRPPLQDRRASMARWSRVYQGPAPPTVVPT